MQHVRNYAAIRRRVREKIIKENFLLFFLHFADRDVSHSDWKSPHGRMIVNIYRRKVGYSANTANCDIYYLAYGDFQRVTKKNN